MIVRESVAFHLHYSHVLSITAEGSGKFDNNAVCDCKVLTLNKDVTPKTNYTLYIQASTNEHKYSVDKTTMTIMTLQEGMFLLYQSSFKFKQTSSTRGKFNLRRPHNLTLVIPQKVSNDVVNDLCPSIDL